MYAATLPNPTWGGLGASIIGGASAGVAGNPIGGGIAAGGLNAAADAANVGLGGGSL